MIFNLKEFMARKKKSSIIVEDNKLNPEQQYMDVKKVSTEDFTFDLKSTGDLVAYETPVIFTHKALSTCNIGIEWYLVEIDYNPETLEVGKVNMVPAGSSKMVAMEKYKIASVNHKVLSY